MRELKFATKVANLNSREYVPIKHQHTISPASREKGPSDISHSVDTDQPLYDVENTYIVYIARKINAIDVMIVKKCRP